MLRPVGASQVANWRMAAGGAAEQAEGETGESMGMGMGRKRERRMSAVKVDSGKEIVTEKLTD